MNTKPPVELLEAVANDDGTLQRMGVEIGKLYTDHGYPLDMSLEHFDMTKSQKMVLLFGAQNWLIEHRRNSNASEKALDRQRASNRETMRRFIETGETGVY